MLHENICCMQQNCMQHCCIQQSCTVYATLLHLTKLHRVWWALEDEVSELADYSEYNVVSLPSALQQTKTVSLDLSSVIPRTLFGVFGEQPLCSS